MFVSESTQYLDVFMDNTTDIVPIVVTVFAVSALTLILSLGFISTKPWSILVTSLALLGCIGAPIAGQITYDNQMKIKKQVMTNMKENVKKKNDQELHFDRYGVPKAENRDKANQYEIIFRSKQFEGNTVTDSYLISFDRETNEPTLSEIEPVEIPTTKEIVEAAKK